MELLFGLAAAGVMTVSAVGLAVVVGLALVFAGICAVMAAEVVRGRPAAAGG